MSSEISSQTEKGNPVVPEFSSQIEKGCSAASEKLSQIENGHFSNRKSAAKQKKGALQLRNFPAKSEKGSMLFQNSNPEQDIEHLPKVISEALAYSRRSGENAALLVRNIHVASTFDIA